MSITNLNFQKTTKQQLSLIPKDDETPLMNQDILRAYDSHARLVPEFYMKLCPFHPDYKLQFYAISTEEGNGLV